MAAVQASQHSCHAGPAADFLSRHLCQDCGRPLAVSREETYFSVLGVSQKFAQNSAELQRRFYEVSRALHPDRFTTGDDGAKRISLERMSLVNEAYRTLKSADELRDYVLGLYGLKSDTGPKGQIPLELADGWFELQDAISENPAQAAQKIAAFRKELEIFREGSQNKMKNLEAELDSKDPNSGEYRDGLQKLARAVHEASYLSSLARDVDRMASRG